MLKQEIRKITILLVVGALLSLFNLSSMDFSKATLRTAPVYAGHIALGLLIGGFLLLGVAYGAKTCAVWAGRIIKSTLSMGLGLAMFGKLLGAFIGGTVVILLCILAFVPVSWVVGVFVMIHSLKEARETDIYNSRL